MESRIKGNRYALTGLGVLLAVLIGIMLCCVHPSEAIADGPTGWNTSHTKYYVDGAPTVGYKKIGNKYYVFSTSGKLIKKRTTLGSVTYFPKKNGVLRAFKKGSKYYYANGRQMTYADSLDAHALFTAEKVLAQITSPSDSKDTKRLKAFRWVMSKNYVMHHSIDMHSSKTWPAIFAMDHFHDIGGDCRSDAGAFAYLAVACGYSPVYAVCDNVGPGDTGGHAWCRINGYVYDPLFAQSKDFDTFYHSRNAGYQVEGGRQMKVATFSAKHAARNAPKCNPNKELTGKWFKNGSYWSYVTGSGRLACGSVKNKTAYKHFKKGAYYVFDSKGRLITGKQRIVKVHGKTFGVAKTGRALSGWDSKHQHYFKVNGSVVTGFVVIKGELMKFDDAGTYDADLSAKLIAASKKGELFGPLKDLLDEQGMKPKSTVSQPSCNEYKGMTGSDVMYTYSGFTVSTFVTDEDEAAGRPSEEYVMGVA